MYYFIDRIMGNWICHSLLGYCSCYSSLCHHADNELPVSRYLNEAASSERRATVLSFRGLSTNLSYGAVSLLYSGLIAWIKLSEENLNEVYNQDTIFVQALGWFPGYFLFTIFLVVLVYRLRFQKK